MASWCISLAAAVQIVCMAAEQNSGTVGEPSEHLIFDPPQGSNFHLNTRVLVQIKLSPDLYTYAKYYTGSESRRYFIGIDYSHNDATLKRLIKVQALSGVKYTSAREFNYTYPLFWPLQLDEKHNSGPLLFNETSNYNAFNVMINNMGYPKLPIHVIEVNLTDNKSNVLNVINYNLVTTRRQRTVDLGFNIVLTVIGVLNTFGIGCVTDAATLKSQLKKSIVPVCIASGTQYIVTPLLTFGLVKAANIDNELAVGLLICACVPGGGLGHLIVLVTGTANQELSIALNCLQICVVLGTAPLWLFSLGQFFPNSGNENVLATHFMVICLAALLVPYVLGMLTRHCKQSASEAILNWLIKPLLLLVLILFVTLGLYINMYAFSVLDNITMTVAGLIPALGFSIGGGVILITRQGKPSAKTVAIEAAIMNCVIVIVAIRFTMPQPDADLASASAIAILSFTPIPFIGMFVFHKIKKKLQEILNRREFEKEQTETIMQSFALITNNALQMSGMTPEQVAERRESERINNIDRTLPQERDSSTETNPLNKNHSFVSYNGETTVVEARVNPSNHKHYI